ncbi:GNAT family N-acetyltransferase [Robertmurraya massiliosenegalensis]|uniref:GNAT family N-acetyltransferase n=1 Tax=Robertmurraya TaxID=2837507 RepID=UPI0039A58A22
MIKEFAIKKYGEIVLELQKQSYQVEAELIGSYEIPPLKEALEQLVSSDELFIGYFIEGRLVGVLSYKVIKGVIDLHRVMVHPSYFRKGIAKSMVKHVEKQYEDALFMIVSTGAKNLPAIEFYKRLGFEKIDENVYGQIVVTNFKKKLSR